MRGGGVIFGVDNWKPDTLSGHISCDRRACALHTPARGLSHVSGVYKRRGANVGADKVGTRRSQMRARV